MTAGALDVVTLAEAKSFLNIPDGVTDADEELQFFITAMTGTVEAEVGPVVAREETADVDGSCGAYSVPAPKWPMLSLASGVFLVDSTVVDVSKVVPRKGLLITTDGSPLPWLPWVVTYQAGRSSIPQEVKAGALEILKLAWATQRGKDAPAFLISYRAAAWFKGQAYSLGFA